MFYFFAQVAAATTFSTFVITHYKMTNGFFDRNLERKTAQNFKIKGKKGFLLKENHIIYDDEMVKCTCLQCIDYYGIILP